MDGGGGRRKGGWGIRVGVREESNDGEELENCR